MRILSIDIGSKNCAFYLEEFSEKDLVRCKKLPDSRMKKELYKIGTRIFWKVVNFEPNSRMFPVPKGGTGDIFVNIIEFLDQNREFWDTCNGIILEKQMKINYNAQVIQHFIFAYFKGMYGSFKYISDISATRKTQILRAPEKMKKGDRKKWAVSEAHLLCDVRDDLIGLKILYTAKSDDLADSCLQLKAFQKLVFIDGKVP